jgi:hypothetical protein
MTDRSSAGRVRGGRRTRWGRALVAGLAVAAVALVWPAGAPGLRAAGEGLALTSTHGLPGDSSTANGTGFPITTAVTLDFDGTGVGSGTTDGSGAFSIGFTVPVGASTGSHTVTACATVTTSCDSTASASYTVDVAPTPVPTPSPSPSQTTAGPALAMTPGHGQPGDISSAGGSGFTAGVTVAITWDGAPLPVSSVVVDVSGAFAADITVPVDAPPGDHIVTACATTTNPCDDGSASATYTVDPPKTPGPSATAKPTARPGGPTQTPEPTTTHLPTGSPAASGSAAPTDTSGPTQTPFVGPSGGTGGGGGPIPPLTLALIAAFAVLAAGLWAFARVTSAGEPPRPGIPGPVERLALGLFAAGVILSVVVGGVIAEGDGPHGKVIICRLDTLNGTYRPISIDATAIRTHLERGDVEPNDAGACP